MTEAQRAALLDMMEAILACDCATADIQLRARTLRNRLTLGGSIFDDIFG